MLLADFLTTLERLHALGYPPLIGLMIAFVVVLALVIGTICLFFWKQLGRAWKKRDEEREKWTTAIEERLEQSEGKHEECEADRDVLRVKITSVEGELDRMKRCHRKDCPMRLPL